MNKNLWLLAGAQGLFLTNNVVFMAINGLVGLALAPLGWMATLPVMGYVLGGALSTPLVARTQSAFGRQASFQIGLLVALASALLCAWAVMDRNFWLLVAATVVAGYYSANGQLYRFAAAELSAPAFRDKAVSLVLAGGLVGAVLGPNLAVRTKDWLGAPFAGAYVALALVALLAMALMAFLRFPPAPAPAAGADRGRPLSVIVRQPVFIVATAGARSPRAAAGADRGRPLSVIVRQPVFIVATAGAALGFGVMNLLMAATPLAMQVCGFAFDDAALVLEWHVIGMFAPGFFTGHLIARFGVLTIMGVGVVLNIACILVALSGVDLHQFLIALFLLGVGWNFLFTGSTTLSLQAYRPEEKNRAQAAINFCVFATMALTSFASGALVTTQGWQWLNIGSLVPVGLTGLALVWLAWVRRQAHNPA